MTVTAGLLALSAALTHAIWNALLRTGGDRLWSVTVMTFAMTFVAFPAALILPLPAPAAWPYLFLSSGLQVGYSVFLVAAYRYGELGQVYPIVRGSVPLLVTLGGLVAGVERLSGPTIAGVALVGLGIMSLSFGKARTSPASVLFALATGLIIAGYTTVDAIGVRAAENAMAYAAWICLIYGTMLPVTYVLIRRRIPGSLWSHETRKALIGGLMSLIAYGAVIAALFVGPAGPIVALRETSVIFAAVIGWLFLGEAITIRRIAACVIVAAGAVLIGWQA